MATSKRQLGVRISQQMYERLIEMYKERKMFGPGKRSKVKQSFSNFIEVLLAQIWLEKYQIKKAKEEPMDHDDFE